MGRSSDFSLIGDVDRRMPSPVIPIFDSLVHPSLDGSWIWPRGNGRNSFAENVSALLAADARWAFAVTMGNEGGYSLRPYVEACSKAEIKLYPVAYMDISSFHSISEAQEWLTERRAEGYIGIKLHPRLGRFDFNHFLLPGVFCAANMVGMTPLLCTYFYTDDFACKNLNIQSLRDLLHRIPEQKVILVHSGGPCLLEVSEMTRHFKNVLLDLSFTMCDYAGSSLDMDLRYVLDRCRGRVCIGSDSPEYSPSQTRTRFEKLTDGFDQGHKERIAYKNIFEFTGLVSNH